MLDTALAALIGLTLLSWLPPLLMRTDPFRFLRVFLAVGAAIVFQLHVLIEGPTPSHWPLYGLGLLTLIGVAWQWFRDQKNPPEAH